MHRYLLMPTRIIKCMATSLRRPWQLSKFINKFINSSHRHISSTSTSHNRRCTTPRVPMDKLKPFTSMLLHPLRRRHLHMRSMAWPFHLRRHRPMGMDMPRSSTTPALHHRRKNSSSR